eukprot:s737_g32.t2
MRFLLLVATLVKSSADKALVLGDSWAEYSLETLQEKCDTITSMVNRGIAGTTAAEWAANDNCATKPTDSLCCRSTGSCSLYDVSFNDTFRTAWVSIGGNDFFLTGCSSDPAMLSTIQANIQKVVADLQNLSPQTTIVLTGYSVPSRPLTWHPSPSCSEFSALLPLNSAVTLRLWKWQESCCGGAERGIRGRVSGHGRKRHAVERCPVLRRFHPPQCCGLSTALGPSATAGGHAMPPGPIRQRSRAPERSCLPGVAGRDPALDALSKIRVLNGPQFQRFSPHFRTSLDVLTLIF